MLQQIILDNVPLPRQSGDRYACWEDLLGERVEMISGRVVLEVRGKIYRARYSADVLDDDTCRRVLAVLRSGKSFPAVVLSDSSDRMVQGEFLVETLTPPSFAFEANGKPVWHGLAFQIREVAPHA